MFKLKQMQEFETANYHGFTLKQGFYYGVNTETNQPICSSGWESGNFVYIYTLTEGKWVGDWYDISEEFKIENIEIPNTKGKLSFPDWLEEYQDISWGYFDNNYSGQMADEMYDEYNVYLYGELPKFVIKYIQNNEN